MIDTPGVLRRAADILGEKGWCQGKLKEPDGRMCAMGALNMAAHELYPNTHFVDDFTAMDDRMQVGSDATKAMAETLGLPVPRYLSELGIIKNPIPSWNDAPGRSVEDVILAMKNAARYVEESRAQSDPS